VVSGVDCGSIVSQLFDCVVVVMVVVGVVVVVVGHSEVLSS